MKKGVSPDGELIEPDIQPEIKTRRMLNDWALDCLIRQQETNMTPGTNDQIKGTIHEVKGAVKEKAGHAANDPNLEAEGQAEKLAGKVQKKVGQIEKVFER